MNDQEVVQVNGLTLAEEARLASLLRRLVWNAETRISPELFTAVCSAFTTVSVELAVVRQRDRVWEILQITRPENDVFYAGRMHGPGGVFYGHQPMGDVLERIVTKELGVPFDGMLWDRTRFLRAHVAHPARGQEAAFIHVLRLPWGFEYRGAGTFYPFDALPENILDHHRLIAEIVHAWLEAV